MPADRVKPLVTEWVTGTGTLSEPHAARPYGEGMLPAADTCRYYGTGTMPRLPGKKTKTNSTSMNPTEIMLSLGGNTMDLVRGVEATVEVLQKDAKGTRLFRIYDRKIR